MFDDDSLIDPNLTSALQALTLPLIYQTILNDDRCLGLRHHDLACARALGFDAPEPDLGLPDRPCLISPDIPTALQHAVEDALDQPESPFNPISPYPIAEGFNTYDRIPVLHFYDHKPEYFDQDGNRLHPPAVLRALKPYETPIRPARIKIRYAAKTRIGKYLYSDTLDLRFHHHAPDGVWQPQKTPIVLSRDFNINVLKLMEILEFFAPKEHPEIYLDAGTWKNINLSGKGLACIYAARYLGKPEDVPRTI